jgi:hypothetical protein
MAEKKLLSLPSFVTASPWAAGMTVKGTLKSVEEIDGVASRKIIMHDGAGEVAIWATTMLEMYLKTMSIGKKYEISCLGKKKMPKSGREAWSFEVFEI